ncbi:MAG: hypothetical protein O3C43_15450 [Verrucomicrobia bacterium]|nr:hypothetical protein [Verrucomicrobiota bacterium]MDA1067887.1 hypothetical protein [Verrucomicrobiota bacterium]
MKIVFASLFFLLISIFSICSLNAANRIVIKAVASAEYVKDRALDGEKKIQTYNFVEGRFYPGRTKNRGLKEFTFMDIVTDMAEHLKQQGYYNHPLVGEGDLLIVVHYGVTDYEESFEEMMGYTSLEDMGYSEDMDAGALADFQFMRSVAENMNQSNEQSTYKKAQLLDMEEAYDRRTSSTEEHELKSMLQEERYFVVLMAYDFPLIKKGETKLLWSTRYSIRAVGQSFSQAIRDMNLVAGDYYGKNIKGLNKNRATDKSRVEMGEIEVIATGSDAEPDNSNQVKHETFFVIPGNKQ